MSSLSSKVHSTACGYASLASKIQIKAKFYLHSPDIGSGLKLLFHRIKYVCYTNTYDIYSYFYQFFPANFLKLYLQAAFDI